MKIGGYLPFSLSDYPGWPAAVVFTQGCNLRCPFCHNDMLIEKRDGMIEERDVLESLARRRKLVQNVVISGGEPCIQDDLPDFCAALKELGLRVKLDTNGTCPQALIRLFEEKLVDYVAMDIKAPPHRYSALTEVPVDWASIAESIEIITGHQITHHFRTTVVTPLLSERDIDKIRRLLPASSAHILQPFCPESARDPSLRVDPSRNCVTVEGMPKEEVSNVYST